MSDDVKQAAIWATSILLTVGFLISTASSCTEKTSVNERNFATQCLKSGKTYVSASSESLGSCV